MKMHRTADDATYAIKVKVSNKILWTGTEPNLNLFIKSLTSNKLRIEYVFDFPIARTMDRLSETLSICAHDGSKAKPSGKNQGRERF